MRSENAHDDVEVSPVALICLQSILLSKTFNYLNPSFWMESAAVDFDEQAAATEKTGVARTSAVALAFPTAVIRLKHCTFTDSLVLTVWGEKPQ